MPQVNLRTVHRLIKAGKIPAVRVGRQWRFRKRDIDAWLDSQRPARRHTRRDAGAPPRRATGAHRRPRVLVVDDEASIRDLLAKTLALAEYDVDVAADGRSALERMRMYPYDLLIADLKMPGMDGLTVIREAKRYKADLPVIIITGFSTESSAIEAVNLGVAGYLTKPFRVPQVLAAAAKALGSNACGRLRLVDPTLRSHEIVRRSRAASTTSRGRSPTANASASAAPTAPARRRCCA